MNLVQGITREQLRELVASKDDNAGSHVVNVDKEGNVAIDLLEPDQGGADFATAHKDRLQFRLETAAQGNGYMGPEAAKDGDWIDQLYNALVYNWDRGTRGYIDSF